jgi:fido (protein-threonine AMPylation protein)
MEDDRYKMEKSERMKQLKDTDESSRHLMHHEQQIHPFIFGSGAHSSTDICGMNKNLHKVKSCIV